MRRHSSIKTSAATMLQLVLVLVFFSVDQNRMGFVKAAAPDQHENCEYWALIGECELNPGYMLSNCATSCSNAASERSALEKQVSHISSFFDLTANDIHGKAVKFEDFKGDITILTNVATYCGRTQAHYEGLVQLWTKLVKEHNVPVHILAFPCNQFGEQEPGSADDIMAFAQEQGVEFTMMEKIDVNGPNASLVYKYLKYHTKLDMIRWNFDTYFVIDGEGHIKEYSNIEPEFLLDKVMALHANGDEL